MIAVLIFVLLTLVAILYFFQDTFTTAGSGISGIMDDTGAVISSGGVSAHDIGCGGKWYECQIDETSDDCLSGGTEHNTYKACDTALGSGEDCRCLSP